MSQSQVSDDRGRRNDEAGHAAAPTESPSLLMRLDVGLDDGAALPLPEEWFERVATAALAAAGERGEVELALLLAGDVTLHRLNRQYRGVDCPTDVLSFPQDEEGAAPFQAPPDRRHLGDVAISLERVRRQGAEHGHSFERELAYLFTHGVLHLAGYDHEQDDAQLEMRRVEEQALSSLGLRRDSALPGEGAAS